MGVAVRHDRLRTWLPEPVLVGRSSSTLEVGRSVDATRVVSANLRVWATFSITMPGFSSDSGRRAARAFFARVFSAWNKQDKLLE